MLTVHGAKDAQGNQAFNDNVRIKDYYLDHKPKGHLRHLDLALGSILEINYLDVYAHTCCVQTPTLKTTLHGALGSLSIF